MIFICFEVWYIIPTFLLITTLTGKSVGRGSRSGSFEITYGSTAETDDVEHAAIALPPQQLGSDNRLLNGKASTAAMPLSGGYSALNSSASATERVR